MRILITGGTGYLGRAIVRAAQARGHTPVVFARHAAAAGLDCTAIDGDVRNRESIDRAVDGCDGICHTAALVAVWRRRRSDFDAVNVQGLKNVLDVARERRILRIVYTSSFLALPPHGGRLPVSWNDYQRTKVEGSLIATQAVERGQPVIRLYPGVIYGPGLATEGNLLGRMIADHFAGKLPGMIGGDRIWSFAYVDDVADAHVAALEQGRPGSMYHLGGENAPQAMPFEIARRLTGRPLPRAIPGSLARIAAIGEEMLAMFGRKPQLTRGTVTILEHDWPLPHDLAAKELGYSVTPLADGVRAVLSSLGIGTM